MSAPAFSFRTFAFVAALTLPLTAPLAPAASADEAERIPVLTANGQGSISVAPDIAIVTMGVLSRGRNASEALESNNTDVAAVIGAVQAQGVEDRDIGTTGFSVSPFYEPTRPGDVGENPPKIIGYTVSNQVRVVIRDIAESGSLLDKVVRAGANQVNGLSFDIDDREAANDSALAAAVADARRKAEIMAGAAGVKLVRILNISGDGSGGGPVFERRAMAMAADAVPVMPGERQITAHASVTWEVAPR